MDKQSEGWTWRLLLTCNPPPKHYPQGCNNINIRIIFYYELIFVDVKIFGTLKFRKVSAPQILNNTGFTVVGILSTI